MGTTHGVRPERLETLHLAFGSGRLIAWSRALPEIRGKLGFLESDFEDLVAVDEFDDGEAWVPVRALLPRRRRNEEGRLAYHLWMIKPLMGLAPTSAITRELVGLGGRRRS
jgi:hypothetical protein